MKLLSIFALFSLSVMVKGAWWATAAKPVILGLGALLGTIDLDVLDTQPIELRNFVPFINKQDKKDQKQEEKEKQEQKQKEEQAKRDDYDWIEKDWTKKGKVDESPEAVEKRKKLPKIDYVQEGLVEKVDEIFDDIKKHKEEINRDFKKEFADVKDWDKKIEERKAELDKNVAEVDKIYKEVLKKWGPEVYEPEKSTVDEVKLNNHLEKRVDELIDQSWKEAIIYEASFDNSFQNDYIYEF